MFEDKKYIFDNVKMIKKNKLGSSDYKYARNVRNKKKYNKSNDAD